MPVFEIGQVYILDPCTGVTVAECNGPTATGDCTRQVGAVVPCAGHRVAAMTANPEHWLVYVPSGTSECPLARSLEMTYW